MSDIRDPERDQVAPTPNDEPSCHDLVIEDMRERKQHGLNTYDSLLQPYNGRSMTQDAYEEVLDLAVYLRGRLEEERRTPQGRVGIVTERNSEGRPLKIEWMDPEDVIYVSSVAGFEPSGETGVETEKLPLDLDGTPGVVQNITNIYYIQEK